eukprot:CAMPEP_0183755364 /NCGR_PEP_ID=MMETSP0739-20130205/4187_1 /TAXON_ID=385413 /ORGANISM="Thalassiosira miniscula, Strain CCMP1093" /LENGTH=63 /DNA_ID=CAMNT_0025992213 /DNA_START=59 /DNA_END=246 /DNA_ORIENTATION=-
MSKCFDMEGNLRLPKDRQRINARAPIFLRPSLITTSLNPRQPSNAIPPISVRVEGQVNRSKDR